MKHIKKFEMQEIKLKDYSERPSERETVHIQKRRLRNLTSRLYRGEVGDAEYEHVEDKITGADPEDGGADHICIIKRKSDGKFFKFTYCDWDRDYNFDRDFPETATEVYPRLITKTIYE